MIGLAIMMAMQVAAQQAAGPQPLAGIVLPKLHTNVISASYSVRYWVGLAPPDWQAVQTNSGPSVPLWLTNVFGGTNPLWAAVIYSWPVGMLQQAPPEEYDFTTTINGSRTTARLYATNAVNGTNLFNLEVLHVPTNVITVTSTGATMQVSSNWASGPWFPVSTNRVDLTNARLGNWFYRGQGMKIAETNW